MTVACLMQPMYYHASAGSGLRLDTLIKDLVPIATDDQEWDSMFHCWHILSSEVTEGQQATQSAGEFALSVSKK